VHSYWCQKGDVTSVTLDTTEGYQIKISKLYGDSTEYYMQCPDGNRFQWSKLARQVPDKVSEILNICDINNQHQLDPPYGHPAPGQRVMVKNLPACPRAGTMGHCHIVDPETEKFIGLVHVNSLED